MEGRRSFVLYTEYEQAFSELEPEEQGTLIMAIFSYVRTGEVAPLSGGAAMAFLFIRGQLDRDWEKYDEIREKRAEAGRKGGKQTQANRANAYIAKQTQAKQADNGNVYVSDNDSDTVYGDGDVDKHSNCPPGVAGWIPPTIAEIKVFCSEQGLTVDAAKFVEHYANRDWLLGGGEPMTDWRTAVAGWAKKERGSHGSAAGASAQRIPGAADYDADNNFL